MKTNNYTRLRTFLSTGLALFALQGVAQTTSNGKVLITGSRFTYPLVEKWIAGFQSKYPGVEVRILPRGSASADSGNLVINAHQLTKEEIKPNYTVIDIGKYALLPIANPHSALAKEHTARGIKEKELKAYYFEEYDAFADDTKEKKSKTKFNPLVYTREQKACAPTAFANFYGFKQENIKGKGISGDDKHLIPALKRDTNGISYNNLGYIYDLKTRQVQPGIAVLPIDLDNNGKLTEDENIYANLDAVIAKIESGKAPEIPVAYVNISYPTEFNEKTNNLKLFVQYILNEGQALNHQFGFLDFEPENLAKQKQLAEASFQLK